MPAAGLKVYEDVYGREAATNLERAQQHNDPQQLADVAQRYLHTKAGTKAAELLGTRCLERDEPMMAAPYFERLVNGPRGADLDSQILVKAALAFYRAGDKVAGEETWKQLVARAKRDGGVNIGGQLISIDQIKKELDDASREEPRLTRDWSYYRGSPSRTGQGIGGPISGESLWSVSTTLPPESGSGDAKTWVEDLINNGTRQVESKGSPALPGFHPIAVPGQVIYRTYNGVYAAYLKECTINITVGGEQITEKKKPGDHAWWSHTDGGVLSLVRDPNKKGVIDSWRSQYNSLGTANAAFENSLTGTLSTDGTRVYAIDDLIVPPHPQTQMQYRMGWGGQMQFGALQPQIDRNALRAFNIDLGGSLRWELGGKDDPHVELPGTPGTKDSFFLGPPLPLADKLYVLNEKDGALRLICLRPKDGGSEDKKPAAPDIVWVQTLANAKEKLKEDFNRRIHAAHLSYGEGILVCPTNAGAVLGVDLLTHSLVWAHQYREPEPPPDPKVKQPIRNIGFNPNQQVQYLINEWKATAPAVIDGKVVFAASDSPTIHCISLRDGREVWKQPRAADDLYFAGVFNGKVLVVGKSYVRALDLANKGKELWKKETGTPSGQGVACDNIYYLPVRASADAAKEPGIVPIDLVKGEVLPITKSAKKEIPGNLIFYGGQLLSQNLTSVVCYPLLPKEGDQAKP
jgi:outer membrane protein assembly factor BamB